MPVLYTASIMGRISENTRLRGNPEIFKGKERKKEEEKTKKKLLVIWIFQSELTRFRPTSSALDLRSMTQHSDSEYLLAEAHPFSDLLCSLPAGSAAHGGVPQPHLVLGSAPAWAGTVSGWWCSSGSSGLADEVATPLSSPSGSSRFYSEWHGACAAFSPWLFWEAAVSAVLLACPEALLQLPCLCDDTPAPLAKDNDKFLRNKQRSKNRFIQ